MTDVPITETLLDDTAELNPDIEIDESLYK